jgi:hypothetical protein
VPKSQNAAVSRNDELFDCDSTAEMVVKIAKDYQNKVFENIKVGLNAALDHAKDLAEPRTGSEAASKDGGGSGFESNSLPALEGATADFHAEVLELMEANVITTFGVRAEIVRHDNGRGVYPAIERASAKTM